MVIVRVLTQLLTAEHRLSSRAIVPNSPSGRRDMVWSCVISCIRSQLEYDSRTSWSENVIWMIGYKLNDEKYVTYKNQNTFLAFELVVWYSQWDMWGTWEADQASSWWDFWQRFAPFVTALTLWSSLQRVWQKEATWTQKIPCLFRYLHAILV